MNTMDTTLFNLRPRDSVDTTPPSPGAASVPTWGPRQWRLLDEQMSLKDCVVYSYAPEEDPSDADDGAIWSLHYFFFNRLRKRVCYIYLRAIPILSHTPTEGIGTTPRGKRTFDEDDGYLTPDLSSSKRARYWLGDRADAVGQESESDEGPGPSQPSRPVVDEFDNYLLSDEEVRSRPGSRGRVRAMSEEIADSMEV